MSGVPAVVLAKGRARPAWAGHPDVFDGAIGEVRGSPGTGDEVDVVDHRDRYVGRGVWHATAAVRVRIYAARREPLDAAFVSRRIRAAVALRHDVLGLGKDCDVYRVVHGAGDRLPGLAVDRYAGFAVLQVSTRAMADRRDAIAQALVEHLGVRGVWERAAPDAARSEDFHAGGGRLAGDAPPDLVDVNEDGVTWRVDLRGGAKTGHFADQRENRARFASFCAGRTVLDAFSGTGGFGLTALVRGGAASVLALDSGRAALERLQDNAEANGVADRVETRAGDAFDGLAALVEDGRTFEAVSVDPPRFARSRKGVRGALRGYHELNAKALALLEPGGILATSSCTGAVTDREFEEVVRDAAVTARRRVQVLFRGGQGPDHPWLTAVPEGRYLKCLVARSARTVSRGRVRCAVFRRQDRQGTPSAALRIGENRESPAASAAPSVRRGCQARCSAPRSVDECGAASWCGPRRWCSWVRVTVLRALSGIRASRRRARPSRLLASWLPAPRTASSARGP